MATPLVAGIHAHQAEAQLPSIDGRTLRSQLVTMSSGYVRIGSASVGAGGVDVSTTSVPLAYAGVGAPPRHPCHPHLLRHLRRR